MEGKMSKGKIALGAIIGAVAGVVAGILTAPKSGEKTRADIKNKATELKEEASRKALDAKARSEDFFDEAKGKVEEYRDRKEQMMNSIKNGLTDDEKDSRKD